jgi:hypothetical protein
MDIEYTYTVKEVDEDNRNMIVDYTHSTYGTITVGVRMPSINETLADVIEAAAPIEDWKEMATPVQEVPVGTSGSSSVNSPLENANPHITQAVVI